MAFIKSNQLCPSCNKYHLNINEDGSAKCFYANCTQKDGWFITGTFPVDGIPKTKQVVNMFESIVTTTSIFSALLDRNISEATAKKYGVKVRYSGNDFLIAESSAISYAKENNLSFVSPYNDIDVISGQGTIGVEMINQMKDLDVVFITVGGGGLISGVGGYLKSINSNIKIIGCSPENSPVMKISLNKGKIIEFDSLPTLSDGSAGGIERDSITYNFCEEFIDDFYLVSEEEIID